MDISKASYDSLSTWINTSLFPQGWYVLLIGALIFSAVYAMSEYVCNKEGLLHIIVLLIASVIINKFRRTILLGFEEIPGGRLLFRSVKWKKEYLMDQSTSIFIRWYEFNGLIRIVIKTNQGRDVYRFPFAMLDKKTRKEFEEQVIATINKYTDVQYNRTVWPGI